jgi:IclR family transcriptional regulator, KDG regulon repressor
MNKQAEKVSSLRNSLKLLQLFTLDEPEHSLTELSDKLGAARSTIHRLTSALMKEGFLARDMSTKRFRLGSSLLAKGTAVLTQFEVCRASHEVLEWLTEETGETAHLCMRRANKVIYLQKTDSRNYVHLLSHSGRENDLHCTSSGQAILAYSPEDDLNAFLLSGLKSYTPLTIVDPSELKMLLASIRKNGYAFSKEEYHPGVSSIAAPVFSPDGGVLYSVSIAGPSARIHHWRAEDYAPVVKSAAAKIAQRLKNYLT